MGISGLLISLMSQERATNSGTGLHYDMFARLLVCSFGFGTMEDPSCSIAMDFLRCLNWFSLCCNRRPYFPSVESPKAAAKEAC